MGIYFKKYFTITVVAILSLAIASCSSEGEQKSSTPPAPTSPSQNPAKAPNQAFNNPVIPGTNGVQTVASTASNLIQPTNGKEREAVVNKGRSDPFAKIGGQIVPILPKKVGVTTAKPVPVLPTLNTLKSKPPIQIPGTTIKPKPNPVQVSKSPKPIKLIPVLPKVLPQIIPNRKLASVLPPPPQPKVAQAVAVSGVIVVGREPLAIIKLPSEPTGRYVRVGERLANGVLIKRIEMNEGSEPTVILEQFGIEVAKMVGEEVANPKSANASNETNNSSAPPEPTTI